MTSRHAVRLLLALAVGASVTSCATASERLNAEASPTPVVSVTPSASSAQLSVVPAAGATDVFPDEPVTVTAVGGKIQSVVLSGPAGEVDGQLGQDGTSWTSTDVLGTGTAYTLTATAVDRFGLAQTLTSAFTTLIPPEGANVRARVSPLDGETVGVGMPIVLYLTAPVEDRAAVERRLSVVSQPAVEGAWHWLNDEELHWRPKDLWPAGSQVTVNIPLNGVHAGEDLWGDEDRVISFFIADHAVESIVDLTAKNMQVMQDGQLLRTLPISAGKPGWETRNGIKVILSKETERVMDAATVGIDPSDPEYYSVNVEFAMRMTLSGEFVHAAPWSEGSQGEANVSHGCVGLSTADAAWLFDLTTRGDIVRVIGSPRALEVGNGYTDWNVDWPDWVAGGALASASPVPSPTS